MPHLLRPLVGAALVALLMVTVTACSEGDGTGGGDSARPAECPVAEGADAVERDPDGEAEPVVWQRTVGLAAVETGAVVDGILLVSGVVKDSGEEVPGGLQFTAALDVESGERVWCAEGELQAPSPYLDPAGPGAPVLLRRGPALRQELVAVDPVTGEARWVVGEGSASVTAWNDTVALVADLERDQDGTANAVALEDGTVLWSVDGFDFAACGGMAGFVAAMGSESVGLNATDGAELWRRAGSDRLYPCAGPDGLVPFSDPEAGTAGVRELATGEPLLEIEADGGGVEYLVGRELALVFDSSDDTLAGYSLDGSSSEMWRTELDLDGDGEFLGPMLVDGQLFLADEQLVVVDARIGERLSEAPLEGDAAVLGVADAVALVNFMAEDRLAVVALDDGEVLWQRDEFTGSFDALVEGSVVIEVNESPDGDDQIVAIDLAR